MRVIVVIALALSAACAAPRAPLVTPSRPIVLALISWNMHAGRGDLPRLVGDIQSGAITGTPPPAFVLMLQEAVEGGPHDVTSFAAARGLSAFFVPVREDGGRIAGNALLSTLPLVNTRAIALPRERQPRAAAVAEIEVGGQRMFVASTHLENRVSWLRGGLLSDTARGRQAEALLRALPAADAGILGGDMNTWLGEREPAWRAFLERFDDTPRARAAQTFRDRLVLDHVFLDLPQGWRAATRVLRDTYGSDHHPVLAVVF